MIRSMTGYGKAEVERDGSHLSVEAWSVNHRYLDVSKPLHSGSFTLSRCSETGSGRQDRVITSR